MAILNKIQIHLAQEAVRRNLPAAIGNLILLATIFLNDLSIIYKSKFVLFFSAVILVFNLLRIILNYPQFKTYLMRYYPTIILSSAFGWSLLTIFILQTQGIVHPQFIVALIVLAGVSSSAAASLAPMKKLSISYLAIALLLPSLYLITYDMLGVSLAFVALAFFVFLSGHVKMSFDQLVTIFHQNQSLEKTQSKISHIFDSVPGFVSLVSKDLKYKMINKKLADYLKKSKEEVVGAPVGFAYRKSQFLEEVTKFLNSNSTSSQNVKIQNTQNGYWYLLSMTLLPGSGDILCMSIDISKEVDLEHKAEEQKSYLLETAKLAELGEIAAGVAHEINNPLAIIHGKTSLLRRRITRDSYEKDFFESSLVKIEQTTDRIASIVRSLVTFAKNAENEVLTNSYVRKVVNDTLQLMNESLTRSNIEVKIIVPEYFQIYCKPTQISQALFNLITNSREAILDQENPWIEIKCIERGNSYVLSVTDSGTGIPESISSKLMLPFFTTKGPGAGTGFGLTFVQTTIKKHGGKFYYDSKSPNTKFIIELPKSLGNLVAS